VEPAFNWRGSMMANAGRDPIFWGTLAVGEQDFLPGNGGAGDLCIRCHSTAGWLADRSTPTDGSGLSTSDTDGVECDFCHKMTNPDNSEHQGVMNPPFIANDGAGTGYYGSGMYSMWGGSDMLGPYSETNARHQFLKSNFHRNRKFCGTCHDVSNPAVGNIAHNFGAQDAFLTTETVIADDSPNEAPKNYDLKAAFKNAPYKYGIVERTFSEYMSSLVPFTPVDSFPNLPTDLQGGALLAMYNAATKNGNLPTANYEDGETRYYTCQTCHMRPVTGQGCNKNPQVRDDLPLHDMTGGNYWMPEAIKYLDTQGKLRLGGGLTATQLAALDAGALRAKEQLDLAATLSIQGNTVKIVNHTGHKLISGYPEGRRMWLNIKWYDADGNFLREDGEYGPLFDPNSGSPVMDPLTGTIQVESIKDLYDPNTNIYEAHYGMTQEWAGQLIALGYPGSLDLSYDRYNPASAFTLAELANQASGTYHETFHFVLNNKVVKDNRIPPYGMSYYKALQRNSLPVPANQYNGGPGKTYEYFDTFHLNAPQGAASAVIDLLYQPTSYEYQLFLLKANNKQNTFLALEGDYMFEAWLNTKMATPYVMTSATWHDPTTPQCDASTPTIITAIPGDKQVDLEWSSESAASGYNLYYDQAGKAQLILEIAGQSSNSYIDTGLTNDQEYCYKVTSWYDVEGGTAGIFDAGIDCESNFSNILCAIPVNPGQTVYAGVDNLETGKWVKSGKGKNATTTFQLVNEFVPGDSVVIQAYVKDEQGVPLPDAVVNIEITGPESVNLTTGPSDINGIAEATWQTKAPNKKGVGGTTPGAYIATTANVTATGYTWDGLTTSVNFNIN
jgi:hypothetical protein